MWPKQAIVYERLFASYAQQVRLADSTSCIRALQVGVGDGVVSAILRSRAIELVTLDHDPLKKPTIVADILRVDASDQSFPLVLCCGVLNNIDPSHVRSALYKLYNFSSEYVIVSVPATYFSTRIEFSSKLLELFFSQRVFRFDMRAPFMLTHHNFSKNGEWKLGHRGSSKKWFTNLIEEAGFLIEESLFVQASEYEFVVLLKKA